jgi:hypothetical protein
VCTKFCKKILERRWELRPQHPLAWRLSVALRRGPPANRRERRALGTHALARDAEILGGAGKTFPRALELFEICRTFGTLPTSAVD